jgi:hypothetical protein
MDYCVLNFWSLLYNFKKSVYLFGKRFLSAYIYIRTK